VAPRSPRSWLDALKDHRHGSTDRVADRRVRLRKLQQIVQIRVARVLRLDMATDLVLVELHGGAEISIESPCSQQTRNSTPSDGIFVADASMILELPCRSISSSRREHFWTKLNAPT
jgi:hypothetical protein